MIPGRILSPRKNSLGYLIVTLRAGKSVHHTARVHRLVAQAFIPNVERKPCVNHIDFDRANASASNLEWCTQGENLRHSRLLGRIQSSYWTNKRSPNASLSDESVRSVREEYAAGGCSISDIGKKFGISKRTAGRIINMEVYKNVR